MTRHRRGKEAGLADHCDCSSRFCAKIDNINGRFWTPSEPLAWEPQSDIPNPPLQDLAAIAPRVKTLAQRIEPDLYEYENHRLKQLLQHLEQSSVDIAVLPEYSLPAVAEIFETLARFSPKLTVVAGIGVVRADAVRLLAEYSPDPVEEGMNVAVVFTGEKCHLIAKRNAADHELITPGTGIRTVVAQVAGRSTMVAVAICKDYLNAGHNIAEVTEPPDLVVIPALSAQFMPFAPDSPRDFPRIFANHSRFGGSQIFASGCDGLLVADRLPIPLPPGAEGSWLSNGMAPLQRLVLYAFRPRGSN